MFFQIKPDLRWFVLSIVLCSLPVHAGFLDMPDIEEVPEAENDVLLKDLNIPAVRDRSPDPDAGPRLNVTQFRIQGVVEFPELGITREALIELVEGSRYNMMKEGDLLYSGYTAEELSELEDLLVDIEKETRGVHVDPLDVQRLVFLVRDQRRRRGVTLGMLEDVASDVTNYYRERGFILAKAFIPRQKVRDGVVTLTLLLGELGDVEVVNNKSYSSKTLQKVFKDDLHKPVTFAGIEEKLLYLNNKPGLSTRGFFSPGKQVGDTTLKVEVTDEDAFAYNLRTDNHGSDVTGEYRLYGDFIFNNPLKYGDRLHVALMGAVEPETASYGSIRYSGNLGSHRWNFDVGGSRNAFVLGLEKSSIEGATNNSSQPTGFGGVSTSMDVGLSYQMSLGRIKTTSLRLSASSISAQVKNRSSFGTDDEVTNVRLDYFYDFLQQKSRVVHNGSLSLTYSQIEKTIEQTVFDDALVFGFNYKTLRFVKSPVSDSEWRWVNSVNFQYSGKSLLSVNQFALAGPTKSKAFKTNTFFADNAIYLGSELIFDAPNWASLNKTLQPKIFMDAAYGEIYSRASVSVNTQDGRREQTSEASLVDVGVGVKFRFASHYSGNLSIAAPVHKSFPEGFELGLKDEVKVYFDFQAAF